MVNPLCRLYDSAPSHGISKDRVQQLQAERIHILVLGKSTTGFSQPLDCSGLFRSLKSALRAGGFKNELGGSAALLAQNGVVTSLRSFWEFLSSLHAQYCSLESFGNLGFSFLASRYRENNKTNLVPFLNSRVRKLYDEAEDEKKQIEANEQINADPSFGESYLPQAKISVQESKKDVEPSESDPVIVDMSTITLTQRQKDMRDRR